MTKNCQPRHRDRLPQARRFRTGIFGQFLDMYSDIFDILSKVVKSVPASQASSLNPAVSCTSAVCSGAKRHLRCKNNPDNLHQSGSTPGAYDRCLPVIAQPPPLYKRGHGTICPFGVLKMVHRANFAVDLAKVG